MRIIAKVSVRPSETGHGLSNRTDIPFTPYQLSPSFLGFYNVRVCLNALVGTPRQNSGFYIPEFCQVVLHQDILASVKDLWLPLGLSTFYLSVT